MKQKRKFLRFVSVFIILGCLWTWRYHSLNSYYDSTFTRISQKSYQLGETVSLGQNKIGGYTAAEGYTIRVDAFEILDYEEYIENTGYKVDQMFADPEKVGLVSITLANIDSTSNGIMLTDFVLHGIDNYVGLDWNLLTVANPILQGNHGIQIPQNTEVSLTIPFDMYRSYFNSRTWNNLNEYKWFFKVTSWPEKQLICLT